MEKKFAKRDYWPTEEWKEEKPDSLNINSKKLKKLEELIVSQYKNINGIVVVRKGYIVFERYNGFKHDDTHNVASVTKSFTSALIGIALDKGYIQSIDQKVLEFFPEYEFAPSDIKKRAVTIRQLLTMTAPIASKSIGNKWEPLDRLRRQPNWVKYILDVLGKGNAGKFQYSTSGVHLLSAIITQTTGKSAREFANEYLFKPIGIKDIPDHEMKSFLLDDVFGKNVNGWVKDPQNITAGGFGLTISPRDMARFGFLYLNEGVWGDKQIIPKQWVVDSIALNPNNYGYLWWLKKENGLIAYLALGSGGSMICCIPEKDLVVAIATKIVSKPHDPWILINKYIVPAVY